MLALVANNLVRRRGRTVLTALGVGMGVAIIVALLSLTQGLQNTAAGFVHLGGSDLGVFQSGVSDPTASVLPGSLPGRLAEEPHVARATPVVLVVEGLRRSPGTIVFGVQAGSFFMRNLVLLSGALPAEGQLVVGEGLARSLRLAPGSSLVVKGRRFTVSGVYHSGVLYEDSGAVLPIETARALEGRSGEETLVAVQLAAGAHPQAASHAIERRFPGTEVISTPEQAARAGANAQLISGAVGVIIVVALIVGGISVTNTMVMSTMERQGEFALMATVGWSSLRIGVLIMGEGVAVSLLGAAIGLLLGVLGSEGLVHGLGASAYVTPSVTAWGLGRGLIVGIAVGVLGGIYPAWRVTHMAPRKGLALA
ncbi:MAG: ABC transporter permease [Solirubrobacteraceae bacterium]